MDSKQIINYRQFAWLTAAILTGGGLVSIQQILVRVGHSDAWSAYMIPMLYALVVAALFGMLVKRFPNKHIFEINKIVFGSVIGTIANLVLLFHLWLILTRDLSSFGKFVGITLLPNTPGEIIILLLVLLLISFGNTSIEVLARVNDLFFPAFVVITLLTPLALSNEMDLRLVQPILTRSWSSIFSINVLTLGWYGDIFVMGAFLHTLWGSQHVRSAIRHGALLATLMISLFILLEIVVLGSTIPGNLVYPNYSLIQQIHISDFLDRMDLIILSIWFPVTACAVLIIYLAFQIGVASLVSQRDYSTINTPIALLVLITTVLAFKSTTEVFSFGNFSSPVIMLSYQPVLFVMLGLLSLRHPIPQPKTNKQPEDEKASTSKDNEAAQSSKTSKPASPLQPKPFQGWEQWTHLLLTISLAALIIGLWKGNGWASLGLVCGCIYGLCSILLVYTSYMETHSLQQKLTSSPQSTSQQ
ncbi:spore germination protein (amino acid permease) [Paenibacillus sp. 1_12]|uniref:GerAB/ArcD/ProY family transporter n=1 Tax=Paenibacillus sp. 1_12 TaxID=1566278 RepID=UPI0008F27832|nr:endospore germination permease [Paenibacillus sp. 1_12]SFL72401.1 spore germination protein (amino acid permease) [Paenibacillus sp. 1_12]